MSRVLSDDYLGNAFALLERCLAGGVPAKLNSHHIRQILAEVAALVEKANALVRENDALRAAGGTTSAEAAKPSSPNVPTGIQ